MVQETVLSQTKEKMEEGREKEAVMTLAEEKPARDKGLMESLEPL